MKRRRRRGSAVLGSSSSCIGGRQPQKKRLRCGDKGDVERDGRHSAHAAENARQRGRREGEIPCFSTQRSLDRLYAGKETPVYFYTDTDRASPTDVCSRVCVGHCLWCGADWRDTRLPWRLAPPPRILERHDIYEAAQSRIRGIYACRG